jgi:hypothetical protein
MRQPPTMSALSLAASPLRRPERQSLTRPPRAPPSGECRSSTTRAHSGARCAPPRSDEAEEPTYKLRAAAGGRPDAERSSGGSAACSRAPGVPEHRERYALADAQHSASAPRAAFAASLPHFAREYPGPPGGRTTRFAAISASAGRPPSQAVKWPESQSTAKEFGRLAGAFKPTPGLEPGTPSLRGTTRSRQVAALEAVTGRRLFDIAAGTASSSRWPDRACCRAAGARQIESLRCMEYGDGAGDARAALRRRDPPRHPRVRGGRIARGSIYVTEAGSLWSGGIDRRAERGIRYHLAA